MDIIISRNFQHIFDIIFGRVWNRMTMAISSYLYIQWPAQLKRVDIKQQPVTGHCPLGNRLSSSRMCVYTLGQKFSDFFLDVSNLQINLFGLLQKIGIL